MTGRKTNRAIAAAMAIFFLAALVPQAFAQGELAYLAQITGTRFLPQSIQAGDTVSVAIDVFNKGTQLQITDLNVSIDAGDHFEAIQPYDYINVIGTGATKTSVVKLKVKGDTPPGYYQALLTMDYMRDTGLVTQTQAITIPVASNQKSIDVKVSPSIINPGKQTDLQFSLSNLGGTTVSNILFAWTEANGLILPLGSDNKKYISTLQPGESSTISYTVAADPNMTPGIYPLTVTMTFSDFNGTQTRSSQVGLIVGGTTDFDVSSEVLSTGQLSLSIANVGSNNAGAVVVKIPPQPGVSIAGSNVVILGNLNKGDYSLANFSLQSNVAGDRNSFQVGQRQARGGSTVNEANATGGAVQSPGAGSTPGIARGGGLTLEIDYTDTTGIRQIVQKPFQLSSRASASGLGTGAAGRRGNSDLPLLPMGIFAVLGIAAIAYNHFKAKKEWKLVAGTIVVSAALFGVAIFLLQGDSLSLGAAALLSLGALYWLFGMHGKAAKIEAR
ncbi:NPCBM-associated, NEW3 domain of alpha-galactosidase [uncultured archaeon]|nr:NPCBM-associated, NEW3 domain of alpha-galactosidase [uncultured archaeon]